MAKTDILHILHAIQNIPYKYYFAVYWIIGILIVFFIPITYPTTIHADTQAFYDYVQAIPTGSVILYDYSSYVYSPTEILTYPVATYLEQLFLKPGIKILAYSISAQSPAAWEVLMRAMPARVRSQKTYGVDLVYLGYIPGVENAIAAVATNIRGVAFTDYYGTPLDSIPMMVTGHPKTGGPINDYTAFYVTNHSYYDASTIAAYARVWGDTYHIPMVKPGSSYATDAPYIPKYIVASYLTAYVLEHEYLIGVPSLNQLIYAIEAYVSLGFTAWMILLNIASFMEKSNILRQKKEVTAE